MKVNLVNLHQVFLYVKHNVKPVDMFSDENTGRLVFVFDKADTEEVWELYKINKLY